VWVVFALLAAVVSATVVTLSKAGIKNVPSSLAFAIEAVLIIVVSWGTVLWQGLLPEIGKIDRKSWIFLLTAGVLTGTSSLLTFRALSLGVAAHQYGPDIFGTAGGAVSEGKADLAGTAGRWLYGGWCAAHCHLQAC
jgi:uncharacterized membrane protein